MTEPPSRNFIASRYIQPVQCGNNGRTCEDTPNGLNTGRGQAPSSVCSGAYKPGAYDGSGTFAWTSQAVTPPSYTSGGTLRFRLAGPTGALGIPGIWHNGRMQFTLFVGSASYVLQPVDRSVANGCPSSGDCRWWYPGGAAGSAPQRSAVDLQLPAGVTCDRCFVQMRYQTANDGCNPNLPDPYARDFAPYGSACTASSPHTWEQFWNCADVRIGGGSGTPTPTTPTPTGGCTSTAAPGGACGNGVCCPGGQCCSKWGWCGSTVDHCSTGSGCQTAFGSCSASGRKLMDGLAATFNATVAV